MSLPRQGWLNCLMHRFDFKLLEFVDICFFSLGQVQSKSYQRYQRWVLLKNG